MEHPEVRLHYFAFIFFLVYGTTVAIGTALLSMARKGRYSELSRRETKTEDANSPATSGTLSAAQLQQVVATAFAGTMALCLAATMWSLATSRISRRWGLDWEVYVSLFTLSCMWLLVQAAWMARTRSGPFATTAFLEASIGGTWPIISDVYDSLKDVMVAGLCMKSDSYMLKFLGVASIVWLVGVHVGFLMNNACIVELAGSYAPVLMLTSKLVPVQTESDAPTLLERLWQQPAACCCEVCEKVQATCMSTWRDILLPLMYKQVTPTKRRLLVWENIFQAIVGIAYMKLEGGSAMIAILNLAIPAVQIGCTFVFYDCLKRQVAPYLGKRLSQAAADGNELVEERLLAEADFENDAELFIAVAPHIKHEPLLQRVIEHMEFENNLERFCAMAPGLNDYQGGITINATDREEPLGDPPVPRDLRFQRKLGDEKQKLGDKELRGLFGALQHLQRLSRFTLKLGFFLGEEATQVLLDALQHLTDLKDLELPVRVEIRSLEGCEALLGAVAKMTRLHRLELWVPGSQFGSFPKLSLASALQGLQDLEQLALGDYVLTKLEDESVAEYAQLGGALGQLRRLHTLHLPLSHWMRPEEVTALLQGLEALPLRRLSLDLPVQQVEPCGEALRRIGAPELLLNIIGQNAQPTAQLCAALAQQPRQRLIFGFSYMTARYLRATAECLAELPQLPQLELRGRSIDWDAAEAAPQLAAALRRAATEHLIVSYGMDISDEKAEQLREAVAREVPDVQTQLVQKEEFDW